MRILVVYRHFWPDSPPYASMLRTITAHLVADGHDVTMLTEKPCYKRADREIEVEKSEQLDGVAVHRLGRIPGINFRVLSRVASVVFPLRVVLRSLRYRLGRQKYDVVWTATMPPAINGLGARIAAKILGAKFIYHFQDIYPELQTFSGNWPERGILSRLVGLIDGGNTKAASALIALSPDMADTIRNRGVQRDKLHVINNFMLGSFGDLAELPTRLEKSAAAFRVIFAGNLGRFQGLEALIDAARILATSHPEIEVMLLGEGASLASLKERASGLPNVKFEGHMPFDEAKSVIASADLGLVSIQPGIYRTAYPSKTLTYIGLGVPVLAVVEPESALVHDLEKNEIGWCAGGSDGDALANAISAAYDSREKIPAMRARALDYYKRELSKEAVLDQWSGLIQSMESK